MDNQQEIKMVSVKSNINIDVVKNDISRFSKKWKNEVKELKNSQELLIPKIFTSGFKWLNRITSVSYYMIICQ